MTSALTTISATVLVSGAPYTLSVTSARVTLDEGWAPYAQAALTVAMPSQTAFDALDHRLAPRPRVTVTATREVAALGVSQSRTFDLVVQERKLDHNAATVDLALASDEALLQDRALVATVPDSSALVKQASVRDIVNSYVLSWIGATLQPGAADADFTTLADATNLILNPSAETDASNWLAAGNSTISRIATQAFSGTACIQMNLTGASTGAVVPSTAAPGTINADPGTTYTFLFYVKSATIGRTWQAKLRFYDAANAAIGSDISSANVTSTTTGWTRVYVTGTAPATAAKIWPVIALTSVGAANEKHYLDAAMLVEGDGKETNKTDLIAYFDGAAADTALYNYQWTGTPGASTSSRVPVFQRDPDTLAQQPGESSWDFIAPVLTQAGLRLFCDECRRWWLVDAGYAVDGRVTIASGYNVYRAADTISRSATADDGSPAWFDSVVVKYTWNGTDNQQQTRFDVAGPATPTKTATVEYERPFPGPGAAAYILSRVTGQGRTLDLTAALDLSATPGMEAVASLPSTPDQTGYASSVSWDFDEDEMRVGTRGLTDTPPSAWVRLAPGEAWNTSPAGASWLAETI